MTVYCAMCALKCGGGQVEDKERSVKPSNLYLVDKQALKIFPLRNRNSGCVLIQGL